MESSATPPSLTSTTKSFERSNETVRGRQRVVVANGLQNAPGSADGAVPSNLFRRLLAIAFQPEFDQFNNFRVGVASFRCAPHPGDTWPSLVEENASRPSASSRTTIQVEVRNALHR